MTILMSKDGTQIPAESGQEDVEEQPSSSKLGTMSVARREFLKTSVFASGGIFVGPNSVGMTSPTAPA